MSGSPSPPPGPVFCMGAGAIGSLVGGRLALAGVPVGLIGRGPHLDEMRRGGLVITSGPTVERVGVPAFPRFQDAISALGPPAAIVLTVKAYDAEAAAAEIASTPAGLTSVGPVILCLQNGVGGESLVARFLASDRVLAGAITLSVERPEPGRLRLRTDQGGITLAPAEPRLRGASPKGTEELVRSLVTAGFRVRRYPRGDAVKWSKLLLNLWANATCAIFALPPDGVAAEPSLFHLDWLAFREALTAMRRSGIPVLDLPGYPVRLLAALGRSLPEGVFRRLIGPRLVGGRGGKQPSLWLDLEAGRRRTEVAYLNGAVCEAARSLGLAAPANRALTVALETLAARRVARDYYSVDPGRLGLASPAVHTHHAASDVSRQASTRS